MANLQRLAELSPRRLTAPLTQLAAELGCPEPRYIPLASEPEARSDMCTLNVMRAIRRHGGEICYGWLLRECPALWISAEFHAVRIAAPGVLVDETPHDGVGAGDYVLFALDRRRGPRFDFRDRPNPIRKRTYSVYGEQTSTNRVDRGTEAGEPALASVLDGYLHQLSEIDEILQPTLRGRICTDPQRFGQLSKEIEASQRRVVRLIDEQEKAGRL